MYVYTQGHIMDLIDLLIIMYIVAGIVGWVYVATTRK
jgi:hypothetical protein